MLKYPKMSINLALWIMIVTIVLSVLNYLYTIQQNKVNDDNDDRASSERNKILKEVRKNNENKDLFDMIAQERKKEINDKDRNDFSKIIELIYSYFDSTSIIKTNVFLPTSVKDSTIRMDILITKEVAGHQLRIAIKLFPYSNNIDGIDIEIFNEELKEIKATKGVIITRGDFKSSATKTAEQYLIDLCTIEDAKNRDWNNEIKIPVIINHLVPILGFNLKLTAIDNKISLSFDCLVSHDDLETSYKISDLMRNEWIKHEPKDLNIVSGVMDVSDRKWKIRDHNSKKWMDVKELSIRYEIEREKYFGYLTPENYTIFTNHTTKIITQKVILKFPRLFDPAKSDIWEKIEKDISFLTENMKPINVYYTDIVNFDELEIDESKVKIKKAD